nr:Dpy 30 motif [Hymenolepis microstoma]
MEHSDSEYIKRLLGKPLKNALTAIVLYQPLDPIHFLAAYLKNWAVKFRDNCYHELAVTEVNKIMAELIPFNIQLQAERAIRQEKFFLKSERMRVEDEEKQRQAEMKRQRVLTMTKSIEASNKLTERIWPVLLKAVTDKLAELEFIAWKKAERARKAMEDDKDSEELSNDLEEEEQEEELSDEN